MPVHINDEFSIRQAYITDNQDNLVDVDDIIVNIHLEFSLPLAHINEDLMEDMVFADEEYTPVADMSTIKGGITDPKWSEENGNKDRFIFITEIKSPMSKTKMRLYYDRKYEDMIFIPDTKYCTKESTLSESGNHNIKGYTVGIGKNVKVGEDITKGDLIADSKYSTKLPEVNGNLGISLKACRILGFGSFGGTKYKITTSDPDISSTYQQLNVSPVIFVILGIQDDVFKDGASPLPIFTERQFNKDRYYLEYRGRQKSTTRRLIIPVKF